MSRAMAAEVLGAPRGTSARRRREGGTLLGDFGRLEGEIVEPKASARRRDFRERDPHLDLLSLRFQLHAAHDFVPGVGFDDFGGPPVDVDPLASAVELLDIEEPFDPQPLAAGKKSDLHGGTGHLDFRDV